MYRLILASLTVMSACSTLPVSVTSDQPRSTWSLNDLLNDSSRILTQTIRGSLGAIQDRIELDTATTPGTDGEETTHLHLKLFPSGKSQPDDAIGLEGTFRRFPNASAPHFGFDFRMVPPPHKPDPKEVI